MEIKQAKNRNWIIQCTYSKKIYNDFFIENNKKEKEFANMISHLEKSANQNDINVAFEMKKSKK